MNVLRKLNLLVAIATLAGCGAFIGDIFPLMALLAATALHFLWYALLALSTFLLLIGLLSGDRGDLRHLRWMVPSLIGVGVVSYVVGRFTDGIGH